MEYNNNDIEFVRNAINNYNGPEVMNIELNGRVVQIPVLRLLPTINSREEEYWSQEIRPLPFDSMICVKSSLGSYKMFWYKSLQGNIFQIITNYDVNSLTSITLARYNPNV
jgi:hypothetical protein